MIAFYYLLSYETNYLMLVAEPIILTKKLN